MNRDLSKLKFPLFETTEREKELLRQAELYLIECVEVYPMLCTTLSRLVRGNLQWLSVSMGLKRKIMTSLGKSVHLDEALYLDNRLSVGNPIFKNPKLLRRYWITLLLNYNP